MVKEKIIVSILFGVCAMVISNPINLKTNVNNIKNSKVKPKTTNVQKQKTKTTLNVTTKETLQIKKAKSSNTNVSKKKLSVKKKVQKKNNKTKAKKILKKETTKVTNKNKVNTTKDKEKYVRNDAMIKQMKKTIKNNESEYMKTYGYEIEVDSSIKALTNQFTFTENRIKGFITYKFGVIKIYAEDYYCNGQLIMTECYIY